MNVPGRAVPSAGALPGPGVGHPAPPLSLPDQHGGVVTLGDAVAGRAALLVFFPFAFSPICTGELLEVQLDIDVFANDLVQVYGISCDPVRSLRAWGAQEGYRFPLLSDFWPHGEASRAYGVFDDRHGRAGRGTFLIGTDGTVRWASASTTDEGRPPGLLHEAVRSL